MTYTTYISWPSSCFFFTWTLRFRIYFQQVICCCCRLTSMKSQTRNNSPQGILLAKHSNSDIVHGKSRLSKWKILVRGCIFEILDKKYLQIYLECSICIYTTESINLLDFITNFTLFNRWTIPNYIHVQHVTKHYPLNGIKVWMRWERTINSNNMPYRGEFERLHYGVMLNYRRYVIPRTDMFRDRNHV